ncbi:hypothetical protein GGR53DRAFT_467059 [Hypoxylon sp. FL1150]|nr:hypothetical protein GGR53DRAFT_467059 [Hypoxylon sp. FL1150]
MMGDSTVSNPIAIAISIRKPTPPKSLLTAMLQDDMAPKQKHLRSSLLPMESFTESQSKNSGWFGFPPKEVPRLDLSSPYIPPTDKGLMFAEELVESYASQLNQLENRMKNIKKARESLGNNSHSLKQPQLLSLFQQTYTNSALDNQTRLQSWQKALQLRERLEPQHQALLAQDRLLVDEILFEYKAYTSLRAYEAKASEAQTLACSRVKETQKHERNLSTVERNIKHMFGFALDSQFPDLTRTNPAQIQPPPIPDWFYILREKLTELVPGGNDVVTFQNLLNLIDNLQLEVDYCNQRGDAKSWDKVWHDPDNKWPHEFQRLKGGWWRCRSGPEAPKVERRCPACHAKSEKTLPHSNPQEDLHRLMESILASMKDVAKVDQAAVKQRLHLTRNHKSDNTSIQYEDPLQQPIKLPIDERQKTTISWDPDALALPQTRVLRQEPEPFTLKANQAVSPKQPTGMAPNIHKDGHHVAYNYSLLHGLEDTAC